MIINSVFVLAKKKQNLFYLGLKGHLKNQTDLNIKYGDIKIKQHNNVTYLGCILDNNLSGKPSVRTSQWKIEISIPETKIFNLPFAHACSAWYPSLSKRLLKKIQISQNKCIRYCLKFDNRSHVGVAQLKKLNWLLTKERF